jgi:hypothetical protein
LPHNSLCRSGEFDRQISGGKSSFVEPRVSTMSLGKVSVQHVERTIDMDRQLRGRIMQACRAECLHLLNLFPPGYETSITPLDLAIVRDLNRELTLEYRYASLGLSTQILLFQAGHVLMLLPNQPS